MWSPYSERVRIHCKQNTHTHTHNLIRPNKIYLHIKGYSQFAANKIAILYIITRTHKQYKRHRALQSVSQYNRAENEFNIQINKNLCKVSYISLSGRWKSTSIHMYTVAVNGDLYTYMKYILCILLYKLCTAQVKKRCWVKCLSQHKHFCRIWNITSYIAHKISVAIILGNAS